MNSTSKRIDALNGIKGWIIFIIVISHTLRESSMLGQIFLPIKTYAGYTANYTFFMLSGFLTAYSFSGKGISERNFLHYMGKKLIKFWPLYAITNIWQLIYNVIEKGIEEFRISTLILVLLFQAGGAMTDMYPYNFPGWFLCTLIPCYVVHYIVRYLCKDDPRKYIWFFYLLIIWGLILETHYLDIPFCYAHNGEGFSNFFAGCVLYEHYNLIKKGKPALYTLCIAGLALALIPGLEAVAGDHRLFVTFIVSPVLIMLTLEESIPQKLFRGRLSQLMGKNSMSIFLLHMLYPLVKIPSLFKVYTIGYIVYLAAVIAVSAVVTMLIRRIGAVKREPVFDYSYKD